MILDTKPLPYNRLENKVANFNLNRAIKLKPKQRQAYFAKCMHKINTFRNKVRIKSKINS